MAITGLGLVGFVTAHLIGNLQVFLGPEHINRYAHFLLNTGELLWAARLVLLTLVGLHVWTAVTLTIENRAARPVAYARAALPGTSYAARTMIWSGLIIASFVVYHLLHFTAKAQVNLTGQDFHNFRTTLADGTACHDVFKMVVAGFSQPMVAGFYMLSVGLLCWHLSHGVEALFQSLGLRNRAWDGVIRKLAPVLAWVLFLGYVSIPLAVCGGFGKEVLK
jgi:succinate dehydrogenase / fumarate reductase cytochrome b subunit